MATTFVVPVDLDPPDGLLVAARASGRAGLRAALRQATSAHRTLTDLGPHGWWLNRRRVAQASTAFGVAVQVAAADLAVDEVAVAGLVRSWVAADVAGGRRCSLVCPGRVAEARLLGR